MSKSASASQSRYLQTLLATTALVSAGAVQAQTETGQTDQQANRLEEVVVRGVARQFRPEEQNTATGLNLSLVETPQAVTVLTGDMLQTIGANSAYEATDLVPNVQRSGSGFGFSQIVMRGIFSLSRRVNSIRLDNPVTSIRGFALERTEIVRGPATAIYGVTGSFGGEINSILKAPTYDFRLSVGAEVGSYDERKINADISGPLNEDGTVQGRLVAQYHEYGLPLDIRGEDFPNYEDMWLGAVSWDISPSTRVSLTHYQQGRNIDPWDGGALVQTPEGNLALPDADPETWYFSHPDQSNETANINFTLLELDHTFDNGWRAQSKLARHSYDEDLAYFYPFGPFGAYALGDDEIYIYSYDVEREGEDLTFNQSLGGDYELFGRDHQFFAALEYRDDQEPSRFQLLNSAFQGYASMDWYSDENYDGEQPRFTDGSPFLPVAGDREEFFGVRQILLEDVTDLKLSLQTLVNVTDRLQVLGGILYHDSESTTTIPRNQGEDVTPPTEDKVEYSETVFRVGTTYDVIDSWGIIDDGRVYYNYSEGFEPQVFTNEEGDTVSAPQEMEQHEIGFKTEMLGGSVGTSIALFDYEITNIEVSSSFLGSFGGFGSTVLEGTQEATGLELELVGEILPGWNVMANYAYMDAEILNPNNTRSTAPRTTPKNSGAITTTYEFLEGPLVGLRIGGTLKISGDYGFVEGTSNVDRFGEQPEAGAHERVDLHASYAPRSGPLQNFELNFNWKNIFDEDILVAKQGNPGYGIMFIDQQRMSLGLRYKL
ncbi:hypothetical protein CWI75_16220 [Kineobactrum sediminis]|uniref:TonB-dependent receptor plug domain-containing protein n=1 Tax=Kineobactrum sediminis TaxID=1905677 RepID=A0A2N5XZ08_9GAMM|nr:TonB-dependent receptor plug domain-containing protein [Kineobactrum sediminis]PLW81376.1 hypothetical protein CWI75_16220 [Kineobactrum sediminis]